jgi:hypothetical protein
MTFQWANITNRLKIQGQTVIFIFQTANSMFKKPALQRLFTKTLFTIAFVGAAAPLSFAKEGMWLPPTLPARAADMKAEGLEIPVDQLYNAQGTGLNNAVVLFGRGCTGEIISSKGLVLTNHHCGYGTIQGLSSREHDYFAAGFWAMSNKEELPCPGLTVTFVRKMENVTDRITYELPDTMADASRDSVIAVRIRGLEKGYRLSTKLDAKIEPYYRGNQYWVILTETFRDIRLVGFPPDGIGKFGGDTDNWMWPRHTGDFSVFRVYAGKDNAPADYNKDNKPYRPRQFFSINTSGYKEGDFTMVYGFPGYTQEYISSSQLAQVYQISDPVRIDVRTRKLNVWSEAMAADRDVFLKYASKRAGIANGWKKWQGELRGLQLNNVPGKKQAYENTFQYWASVDTTYDYADNLLSQMQASTGISNEALRAEEYIREAVLGIELVQQGGELDRLLAQWRKLRQGEPMPSAAAEALKKQWAGFFRNYDAATDRKVFAALMPMFMKAYPKYTPALYALSLRAADGSYERWAKSVYRSSVVADQQEFEAMLEGPVDTARLQRDPAWQLYRAIAKVRNTEIVPVLAEHSPRMTRLNRLYMAAQMHKDGGRAFYPDANLTLRLAYGHVRGIDPDGPAGYSYQTYIDEVIAKDQPDVAEFQVPDKLKELYAAKDYGRWGIRKDDGTKTLPVAFLADNHTTGGNSGSPVLNARGELIGTNFDRVWEGTMSDLYFDPALCRNISVDIRYTLWVIEKFGGAGWLLKEMKLVK